MWAACFILVDSKFFNGTADGKKECANSRLKPCTKGVCRGQSAERPPKPEVSEMRACAQPAPPAGASRVGTAAHVSDPETSPPHAPHPPRLRAGHRPGVGGSEGSVPATLSICFQSFPKRCLPNLGVRVSLQEPRAFPRRCKGRALNRRLAGGALTWPGCEQAAGWAGTAESPRPPEQPPHSRPHRAMHMETPQKPGAGPQGREAAPQRRGPRCLQWSTFREESRALLLLAGPAVSPAGWEPSE